MKQRTKLFATLWFVLFAAIMLFCLSLVNVTSAYATTGTADYTVKNGNVYLKSSPYNGVKITRSVTTADNSNGTVYEGVSLMFNKTVDFKNGDYDGLLVNVSNNSGAKIQAFMWLVSGENHDFSRFSSASAKELSLVKQDGSATEVVGSTSQGFYWGGNKFYISNNSWGTLKVPFSEFKSNSAKMTAVDQVIIAIDVAYACNGGITVGEIAGYKADGESSTGYVVDTLFAGDKLTFTEDENVTTADINLADMSKGTKVNNVISGMTQAAAYVTDGEIRAWAQNRLSIDYYANMLSDTEKTVSIKYASDSAPDTTYDKTGSVSYSAFYTNVSFKLNNSYNIYSDYAGALIRIANTSERDIVFSYFYLSGNKVIRYSSQVPQAYKPFYDDNGINIAASDRGVAFIGSAYRITANTSGTWHVDFPFELRSNYSSANASAVNEIVFSIRVDERIYAGDGIEIDSIAFYNKAGVITEVYNSDEITATNDATESAGINIADASQGTTVYVDMNRAVWTSLGDYYNNSVITAEEKSACYEWALSKISLGYTGVEMPEPAGTKTVYMDNAGNLYKENAEGRTEISLHLANVYGAEVRLNAANPGIRFSAEIDLDGFNALGEDGLANVQFGMLIASTALAGDSLDFNETNYFINKEVDDYSVVHVNYDGTAMRYSVALIGIPEEHFNDTVIVQSYMIITYADNTQEIVYGEIPEKSEGDALPSNVRSIAQIAQYAIESGDPFTDEQLEILNSFIGE